MTDTEDERKGLPSASAMPRYFECAGAFEAEKDLPSPDTKDSIKGTDRHKMMEDDVDEFDSEGDEFSVTRARWLEFDAISAAGLEGCEYEDVREERLWMSDDSFNLIFSGMPDRVLIFRAEKRILAYDYKMLHGIHTDASKNWQVISLSVLLFLKYGYPVDFALIQPNLSGDKALTMCRFTVDALQKARVMIEDRLKQSGERTVNPHCNFCNARMTDRCPESMEFTESIVDTETTLDTPTTVEMLDKIKLATKLLKDFGDAEKAKALNQLQADPDSLPGYRLNTKTKTTVDTQAAWSKLCQNMNANMIISAMKLSIPQLVKPYKDYVESEGDTITLKESRKTLNSLLEDCIETTEGDPFVEKG